VRALVIAEIAVALLAPVLAQGRVLWESGEVSLEHEGSFKQIVQGGSGTSLEDFEDLFTSAFAFCSDPDTFKNCPAFGAINDKGVVQTLSRLRNRFELRVGDRWSAVAVYDHQVNTSNIVGFESNLGNALAPEQWADLDWSIIDDDQIDWDHLFYRLYLNYEGNRLGVTLGRQRIAWGVGRLWNPIDRFNAVGPLAIESDQSQGVDAFNVRWHFTDFTFLQAVCAAADDREEDSCALRLHGVVHDVDYSIVAGSFEKALTFGFDLAGNVGDAAARAEVVFTHSNRDIWPIESAASKDLGSFWQAVVSVDYLFDLGTGVYLLVEHLYNGNALGFGAGRAGALLPFFQKTSRSPPGIGLPPGPFVRTVSRARFGGSRVITSAENTTGMSLGYDLTAEIRADFLALYDWEGQSASFFPALRYNAFDWLELTLGGQFFLGPQLSQYGDVKPLGYLIAEFFF